MRFKDDDERRAYYREYNKGWYQRHKERILAKRKNHNEELKRWLTRYKSKLCCMVCGESHPSCLQFHHRNKDEKRFTIGSIASRATSFKQIMREIEKCDVLCVNCHAKLHWREKHETDSWEELLDSEQ